jgi:hypothetical protein
MRVLDIKLAFASMFQRFWNCTSGTVYFPYYFETQFIGILVQVYTFDAT